MKSTWVTVVWIGLVGLIVGLPYLRADEDMLPKETTPERYQIIWTRSPFTLSTATPDEQASASWALLGLMVVNGEPTVLLENKDNKQRMTVTSQPNKDGFSVMSVNQQDDFMKSSAQIHTPSQDLVVKYDKDLLNTNTAAAVASAPSVPPPMQPAPVQYHPPTQTFAPPPTVHHIVIPSPPPPPPAKK